jgi:hypothetical protein
MIASAPAFLQKPSSESLIQYYLLEEGFRHVVKAGVAAFCGTCGHSASV